VRPAGTLLRPLTFLWKHAQHDERAGRYPSFEFAAKLATKIYLLGLGRVVVPSPLFWVEELFL